MLTYHGRNRQGTHTIGRTNTPPLAFVESKFKARWETLELFDHHNPDELLGQIYKNEGQRRWWAEDSEPEAS
ncbi:MAG: hypothetical protein GY926_22175 [bacterium]|nr:hypothetical protein [bacterium]